jgi:hypothetical protein
MSAFGYEQNSPIRQGVSAIGLFAEVRFTGPRREVEFRRPQRFLYLDCEQTRRPALLFWQSCLKHKSDTETQIDGV